MGRDRRLVPAAESGGEGARNPAVVHFTDGQGVLWRAYERQRPGLGPALVFESAHAIRLVRDYPANWSTLPRAALEALSWSV